MKTKLTLFIAVIAVALFGMGCASTEPASDPLKKGLVAYYPFNGNSLDESGNGNHGGVDGATLVNDRHGNSKSAYDFNKHVINIPKVGMYNFSAGHSMSVWARVPDIERHPVRTSPDRIIYFVNRSLGLWIHRRPKGATGTEGISTGNRLIIHTKSGQKREMDQGIINAKFNPSEWFLMTSTFDNKAMRLYINGIFCGEGAVNNFAKTEFLARTPHIGSNDDYRPTYASLDDVRIYNRALSAEEVKALYDLEKPKTK